MLCSKPKDDNEERDWWLQLARWSLIYHSQSSGGPETAALQQNWGLAGLEEPRSSAGVRGARSLKTHVTAEELMEAAAAAAAEEDDDDDDVWRLLDCEKQSFSLKTSV